MRALTGAASSPQLADNPKDGDGLYHALACANCHERAELAPALAGLGGQRRELDNGLGTTFDAAYVRESLLSPDAKRVRGYSLRMPSYDGLLDEAGLQVLTDWLLARPAALAETAGSVVTVDPICQMQVRVVEDTPRAPGPAGQQYFCSAHCRERYLSANPLKDDAGR